MDRHGKETASQYAEQTAQIARMIRNSERHKRYILVPGKHKVRLRTCSQL